MCLDGLGWARGGGYRSPLRERLRSSQTPEGICRRYFGDENRYVCTRRRKARKEVVKKTIYMSSPERISTGFNMSKFNAVEASNTFYHTTFPVLKYDGKQIIIKSIDFRAIPRQAPCESRQELAEDIRFNGRINWKC